MGQSPLDFTCNPGTMASMHWRAALCSCLLATLPAFAVDPIVASSLQVASLDGLPSGAYPNAATHFYPQSVAVNFTLSRGTRLSTLTFWGSSDNTVYTGLNNVRGFEIRFYDATFATPRLQFTLLRGAAIQETSTLRVNSYGGREIQCKVNVPGTLPAGTWWMHVGANLIDGVNGDAWLWSPGSRAGVRYTQWNGSAWSAWTADAGYSAAWELRGVPSCPNDLDNSGVVDQGDIALQLLDYGPCPGCLADIDGSGVVDFGDIALTLLETGPCP